MPEWLKEDIVHPEEFELPGVDELDDEEYYEFKSDLESEEHQTKKHLLIDIAKTYLSPLEGDILFLFLNNRRNKAVSKILNIPEPEIARYKKLLVKKCSVFYKYKYVFNMYEYLQFCTETFQLNEKQQEILKMFLDFRSLSEIADKIKSKPSNMHRSLKAIREKVEEALPKYQNLEVLLAFFEDSRYINRYNPSNPNYSDEGALDS